MTTKPNVLFMMADDHRYDVMGCMGDPTVKTPTMDKLSALGGHFRNTHIMGGHSGAVCVPSRATMNTGRNVFDAVRDPHDMTFGLMDIPATNTLMGEWFGQAGYQTFHTGKWHLSREAFNRSFHAGENIFMDGMGEHYKRQIYDYDASGEYLSEKKCASDKHSSELFADTCIDFILRQTRENPQQPFFLSCCFTSPHDPRTAPPEYHAQYPVNEIPLPPNFMPEHPFEIGIKTIRDEVLTDYPRTPPMIQKEISDYYAIITHQDEQMARILAALDEAGIRENTLIVYTGDHGLAVGQHGLLGKQNVYDHSIRPPWIMSGLDIPQDKKIDALVYNFDLFPTLCEATGVGIPESVQGKSRWKMLQGDGESHSGEKCVYAVYCDMQASLKCGNWKLIRSYESDDTSQGASSNHIQLFDISTDKYEMNDLSQVAEHQDLLRDLAAKMHAQQESLGDPLAKIETLPAKDLFGYSPHFRRGKIGR